MRNTIVLNESVKQELARDPILAPAFFALHHGYDWEIDPLFNESYRQRAALEEVDKLKRAKDAVSFAQQFSEEVKNSLV